MSVDVKSLRQVVREPVSGLPEPGAIDLWRVNLSAGVLTAAEGREFLVEPERLKYSRVRDDRVRSRQTASRIALRRILAGYLGADPARLELVASPEGKPSMVPAEGHPGLTFNLARSEDFALIAVARSGRLGVDLEVQHPEAPWEPLARDHFTARERAALDALPWHERRECFYRLWTRKGACLKAMGTGPLHGFEVVEVALGEHAVFELDLPDPGLNALIRWHGCDLRPAPHCAAALVIDGEFHAVRWVDWVPVVFGETRSRQ